ncbi:Uncharacterised protein [Klebsiella quasipneumoniae]|nr:Uncharacterised protein [Klebsiella quasipneumoniae]
MMSLWDALRMNMMISYQELVRTFLRESATKKSLSVIITTLKTPCQRPKHCRLHCVFISCPGSP